MKELTKIQAEILDYLLQQRVKGNMPTLVEISNHFGYRNRSTVKQHLDAISNKGYIKRNPNISRGIELTIEDKFFVPRPVIGEAAAGSPLTIYPDAIDIVELPTIAKMPSDSFLLRVKGDSLKDAYIFDGDIIIINPNTMPSDGQITVVIIEDAAVVKRFFKLKDGIKLVSENPEYEPILIKSGFDKIKIAGVVIGMYRKM